MKWVDISHWVYAIILIIFIVIRLRTLTKISPDDPNSSIEKRLVVIELWIIAIFITDAIDKIAIALCF